MTSPPKGQPVLSSSPSSINGVSPIRLGGSQSDCAETPNHARRSPTLPRSFDPNDPEVRERQRTMDVDMALHLSRARRDTTLSVTSPYDDSQQQHQLDTSYPILAPLSSNEQRAIDIARGEGPHQFEDGDVADDVTHHPQRQSLQVPDDFSLPHLNQTQDPSLLVSLSTPHADSENLPPSIYALPTYNANISSDYHFSLMEEFRAEEKAILGIKSPSARFSGNVAKARRTITESDLNATQSRPPPGPSDGLADCAFIFQPSVQQRKLSQSNTQPRLHRKGIGGKIALFEGNPSEPPPGQLGKGHVRSLNVVPSEDNLFSGIAGDNIRFHGSSGGVGTGMSPGMGILNTGHDRPYRFSFYSNALSATIHARCLSELPAENQTFEELFTGTSRQSDATTNTPSASRSSSLGIRGGESVQVPHGNRNSSSNLKVPDYSRNTMTGGMVGGKADFEGNTWWLDVQSPTDEEMKTLSRVGICCVYADGQVTDLAVGMYIMKVFSIHPLTTEDIQMEESREKIELFRHYYFVCFRSFDQDPYSPTHLEPLNMYIIVFREGTLSVRIDSLRHFSSGCSLRIVSLPPHSSSSKCTTSNQATQRLY
jgi:magnesium transporter